MPFLSITIFEALILASSLSIDAFAASFAYGSNKIRIPMLSVQIINIVCTCILGIALLAGSIIRQYIPGWLTVGISFTILFIIGIVKLLDSITKTIIRKYNNIKKEVEFSMFNFKFILNLYANPEDADVDESKTISPPEALSLAVALSLDGIAIGFGAAFGNINAPAVFLCSFITNGLAVMLGCRFGNKIAQKSNFNMSWVSGVVLIILAFLKLF